MAGGFHICGGRARAAQCVHDGHRVVARRQACQVLGLCAVGPGEGIWGRAAAGGHLHTAVGLAAGGGDARGGGGGGHGFLAHPITGRGRARAERNGDGVGAAREQGQVLGGCAARPGEGVRLPGGCGRAGTEVDAAVGRCAGGVRCCVGGQGRLAGAVGDRGRCGGGAAVGGGGGDGVGAGRHRCQALGGGPVGPGVGEGGCPAHDFEADAARGQVTERIPGRGGQAADGHGAVGHGVGGGLRASAGGGDGDGVAARRHAREAGGGGPVRPLVGEGAGVADGEGDGPVGGGAGGVRGDVGGEGEAPGGHLEGEDFIALLEGGDSDGVGAGGHVNHVLGGGPV